MFHTKVWILTKPEILLNTHVLKTSREQRHENVWTNTLLCNLNKNSKHSIQTLDTKYSTCTWKSVFKRPHLRVSWYTTLLPLASPIKPVFHLRIFFVRSEFLLNSHWLATFFEVKKVGSNPTFYCFRAKKVASYKKFCKWKASFKIKYSNKYLVIFIQISTASRI